MGYNLLMEKFFPGELQFGDPFRFGSFLSYELIVIGQIVTILLVVLCFIIYRQNLKKPLTVSILISYISAIFMYLSSIYFYYLGSYNITLRNIQEFGGNSPMIGFIIALIYLLLNKVIVKKRIS